MFEKNLSISLLVDFYGDILTERQNEMINMYYNEDYSLSEISEITGITRQGVRDSIKKSTKKLYEMEERLCESGFFRAGKSVLVQLRHVKSLKNDIDRRTRLTLENDEQIIVSRQYADELKKKLGSKK